MPVDVNSPISEDAVQALFSLANGKTNLSGTPYRIIDTSILTDYLPVPVGGFGQFALVRYAGQPFLSLIAGNSHLPTDIHYWKPITDRGAWDENINYDPLDKVRYAGMEFISIGGGDSPLDDNGNLNSGWAQMWLSGYNRLRQAVVNKFNAIPFDELVSGPWPFTPPGRTTPDTTAGTLYLYYPDTGKQEKVSFSINANGLVESHGKFATKIVTELLTNGTWNPPAPGFFGTTPFGSLPFPLKITTMKVAVEESVEFSFVVGGNLPVKISGTFSYDFAVCGNAADHPQQPSQGFQKNYGSWDISGDPEFVISGTRDENDPVQPDEQFSGLGSPPVFTVDSSDPTGLISVIDTSLWFQGAGFTKTFIPIGSSIEPDIVRIQSAVNAVVSPGKYTVKITLVQKDDSVTATTLKTEKRLLSYASGFGASQTGMGFTGTVTLDSFDTVNVPGIHNSKQVKRINASLALADFNLGFGLFFCSIDAKNISGPGAWNVAPFPAPDFTPEKHSLVGQLSITSSVPGIWAGTTAPVRDLGMNLQSQMPWNLFQLSDGTFPVQNSNGLYPPPPLGFIQPYIAFLSIGGPAAHQFVSGAVNYFQAYSFPNPLINETQNTPPRWLSGVWYPLGFQIMDSKGNLQTVIALGVTGNTEPTWDDAETVEGGFLLNGQITSQISWQLTRVISPDLQPGSARMYSTPKYPIYRMKNSTWVPLAHVIPGNTVIDANGNTQTCTVIGNAGNAAPGWQTSLNQITVDGTTQWKLTGLGIPSLPAVFNPVGWWIYMVHFNRIGQANVKGIVAPQDASGVALPSIPVDIGCIRNGQFVVFLSTFTGSAHTALGMWPIFTNSPVVYRASEDIDIQASIISCGLNYQTGGTVGYPICATFYNDIEALLNTGFFD